MKTALPAFDLNTARFEELADKRCNETFLLTLKFQSAPYDKCFAALQNLTCSTSRGLNITSCGPGEGCLGYIYGTYNALNNGFNRPDSSIEEDLVVGVNSVFWVSTDDEMKTPEGFSPANDTDLVTHRFNAISNEIEQQLLFSSYSGYEDEDVHMLLTELGGLEVFGIRSQIDEIGPFNFTTWGFINYPSAPVLDRSRTNKKDGLPRTVSTIAVVVALFIFLCYRRVVDDDLELPDYLLSDSESDDEME
ncbi:hypothetical protein FisN_16Lu202 [Fistulifera solaris]|uniref:Uncharacterized protein n=1 Tax=Fistulifera solaris TaxID=1519565 RepID=A0A1Z5KJD0_FISSO|nr:hypothetical protein FisN_16Lu202 [Fistulifera solaris]|eukprot:GAX26356.1 hypothetical protein FisN_16Lu202 [Fistulifera solaris]